MSLNPFESFEVGFKLWRVVRVAIFGPSKEVETDVTSTTDLGDVTSLLSELWHAV